MSRDGKRLGKADRLLTWIKPEAKQLKSLHPARVAQLPEALEMRVVEVHAALRGHRSQPMYFATTLLNARTHDAATIAGLYLRRWDVELFFDDIKTSQHMDMLRCKSPDMVARELLMHLIAYNLVRLLMAQAQPRRETGRAGSISFKGTLDRINQWQVTLWTARTNKSAGNLTANCLMTSPVTSCHPGLDDTSHACSNEGVIPTVCSPNHEPKCVFSQPHRNTEPKLPWALSQCHSTLTPFSPAALISPYPTSGLLPGYTDSDNDGMDDRWEQRHLASGETHQKFLPWKDKDGDGWTNLEEYINKTNPSVGDDPMAEVEPRVEGELFTP
jgi:hypothetical protein